MKLILINVKIFLPLDDLGLELEDEPAPKRNKQEHLQRTIQLKPEGREDSRTESKISLKTEIREKTDHREKVDHREKAKTKPDPPAPRISAKERLGGIVPPKVNAPRDKVGFCSGEILGIL